MRAIFLCVNCLPGKSRIFGFLTNLRSVLLLPLASFLFLACSSKIEPPKVTSQSLPAKYFAAALHASQGECSFESLDAWWKLFNDPVLSALIEKSLVENLDVQKALARFKQAGYRVDLQSADFFPQLGLNASSDRAQSNFRAFRNTSTVYEFSLPASYEIDLWGRVANAAQAGEQEREAAYQDLRSVAMSVAAEVAEQYFLLSEICEQLSLLDRTISSDSNFYNTLEDRYKFGVASALEVYQAKQTYSTSLARRPILVEQLARTQHSLKALLGEYPSSETLQCENRILPRQKPELPISVPSALLVQRPDIVSAFSRVASADSRVAEAVADRFPAIRIGATGGYSADKTDLLFRSQTEIWRAFANLTLTLLDGGRKAARVELQKAVLEERVADYRNAAIKAFKEVEDAMVALSMREKEIVLLEDKVEAVGNSYRASANEYLQGVEDYVPVLLSQVSLYTAQRELLTSRRLLLSSFIQLARALGGGWQESELEKLLGNEKS